MKNCNVRVLTEKDMEGSKHKASFMSEFDQLLEVCRVASELYDQEEQNNVTYFDILDKSWGKRSTHDQESTNKIVLFSSTTWGRKKSRGKSSSSYRVYGYDYDDQVVRENVLGKKRRCYGLKDENLVYPDVLLVKDKVVPGKKRKCCEDSEYSENKDKKKPRRKNNKARNKLVETAPLPVEFANEIQRLGGDDVRLLIQKELTITDLEKDQNRLNISINQIREEAKGFLTEAENEFLDKRGADNRIRKKQVPLLEPNLNRSRIDFKKWEMNRSFWYVLSGPWTAMQRNNHLQAGTDLQVWSFRVNGDLNLALVNVP